MLVEEAESCPCCADDVVLSADWMLSLKKKNTVLSTGVRDNREIFWTTNMCAIIGLHVSKQTKFES